MVRFAAKQELSLVNELRKQVHDVHGKGRPDIFQSEVGEELQESVYQAWESEKSDVIVAIREEKVCGFAVVEYIEKPCSPYTLERKYYHVKEFGVDEKYRRQGIGTELISFIKEQVKERKFERMELDMWEFNESALRFYESVGFRTYRRYMEYEIK